MKEAFVSKEKVLKILDRIGQKADSWAFAEVQRLRTVDFIEPGTTVYIANARYRQGQMEYWTSTGGYRPSDYDKIGKTIFFTEDEADQKVKEWEDTGYDPHYKPHRDNQHRNNGYHNDGFQRDGFQKGGSRKQGFNGKNRRY